MFIDVEYYLENNASLTFHDLPNPPQNFEIRTALLRKKPSWHLSHFFSVQHSVLHLVTRVNNGIFSFPLIIEIFIDVEHYLENNI